MKKKFIRLAVLLAGILALRPAPLTVAQTFRTTDAADQTVRFFADYSLGEVDGTLTPVIGTLAFDPANPTGSLSGRFTVVMASFDSGIGLRDKDMRQRYLHTDDYPEAVFTLDDALPTLLDDVPGDTLRLAVAGQMTLHGVTRSHVVEATLTPAAEGYHVHATFPLRLTDHDITPPRRFMLKVKDDIRVEVELNLVRDS